MIENQERCDGCGKWVEDCSLVVHEDKNICKSCWKKVEARLTPDAQDGATGAATLSGLYNCNVCGQEKCVEPGICDDCLAPPTEFEINQWRDEETAPPVI